MIARLIVRRLAFLIFVLVGISLLTFSLSHVIPSDPAKMMAGPRASKSQVAKIRAEYGLDLPLGEQYVNYVTGLTRLDFGESLMSRRPVQDDLRQYLPASIELGGYAFLLAIAVGVPLGIVAGARQGSAIDHFARLLSISGLALPVFWLALLAQFFFFGKLGWLPDGQRLPLNLDPPVPITHLYFSIPLTRC